MTRQARIRIAVIAVIYLAAVVLIGFWRTPVDAPYDSGLEAWLAQLHAAGVPHWFGYRLIEFCANILFFVPLGFFAALLLPARIAWLAIPLGVLSSGAIELGQLLFLPARYASWGDVLSNSIGATIGCVLALVVHAVIARRARARAGKPVLVTTP